MILLRLEVLPDDENRAGQNDCKNLCILSFNPFAWSALQLPAIRARRYTIGNALSAMVTLHEELDALAAGYVQRYKKSPAWGGGCTHQGGESRGLLMGQRVAVPVSLLQLVINRSPLLRYNG